ncbi:MAG: hypothetical protein ACR2HG_06045 [Pyrinomonadaceae bacterium]
MLTYNFQMQVDSKIGSFTGALTAITSEDSRHLFGLLEAGEKGNSSDLGVFLSNVKKHKDKSQTFKIKWKPTERGKSKFLNLKNAAKGDNTFRLRLALRLVDDKFAAKWADSLEISNAAVKNVSVDGRDDQEVVEIIYDAKSTNWDETLKDQSE